MGGNGGPTLSFTSLCERCSADPPLLTFAQKHHVLTIAIRIDPSRLTNPDLDIRYKIADLLTEATAGAVKDGGYDYVDGDKLAVFLSADSAECIANVLATLGREEICGNLILDSATVGIDRGNGYEVVHPKGFTGEFLID